MTTNKGNATLRLDSASQPQPHIGLPGEGVTLRDVRRPHERFRDNKPEPPVVTVATQILDAQGEPVSSLTWESYCAWRRTKCRPEPSRDNISGPTDERWPMILEILDQATLEFIGEVAELGDLFGEAGLATYVDSEQRARLIDECGDIFFCACWALDAWGLNPLVDSTDLEIIRVTDEDVLAALARVLATGGTAALRDPQVVPIIGSTTMNLLVNNLVQAGMLANSYKKLRYQRREQDVEKQVQRIVRVLIGVNQLLIIANSSVEEALRVNMRKLDSRYPGGYKPGQGGGNRTGEGA